MSTEQAADNLRNSVSELLTDLVEDGMKDLEKLIKSGSGVVVDHMNAEGPWEIPRTVLCALLQNQIDRNTPKWRQNLRQWKQRVKNYYILM